MKPQFLVGEIKSFVTVFFLSLDFLLLSSPVAIPRRQREIVNFSNTQRSAQGKKRIQRDLILSKRRGSKESRLRMENWTRRLSKNAYDDRTGQLEARDRGEEEACL